MDTNFEDILSEQCLILLPVFLVNGSTKSREVDESIFGNFIGQIQDFLLKGVQTQHLKRRMEILKGTDILKSD